MEKSINSTILVLMMMTMIMMMMIGVVMVVVFPRDVKMGGIACLCAVRSVCSIVRNLNVRPQIPTDDSALQRWFGQDVTR